MKSIFSKIQLIIFVCYITVFFVLLAAIPDRDFSEQENRYLQKKPSFSFSALFNGGYTKDFESYITDQFPFRDKWISLKSRSEAAIGKTENNGVFLCSDDTLITRFEEPDMKLVDENISAVLSLAVNNKAEVYLALIPTAAEIWSYRLPDNADTCDQKSLIDYIYSKCDGINTVDMYNALESHKKEYIYYRTDHHWTSLGAYYGYAALSKAIGLKTTELSGFSPVTVSDSFYGTVYSSSGVRWVKPDSIDIYVPDKGVTVTNYPKGTAVPGVVYDKSFLEKKDKYAMFFGGNTPRMVIDTGSEGKKVLILRDSFADSEVPFLFGSFSQIHLIDLRYFKTSIMKYIVENDIDTVVVSYGLNNFATDNSVFLMGR